MDYKKGIAVLIANKSKRDVILGIGLEEYPILSELNNIHLSQINKVIDIRENIESGSFMYGYDELQTQRVVFELYQSHSLVNDFIFDKVHQIDTKIIFDFLIERKKFLSSVNDKEIIDLILIFFSLIKQNNEKYRTNIENFYSILLGNIRITMILEPNDTNITNNEFISSLKIINN